MEPSVKPALNQQGQLTLSLQHAPAEALVRYALPWENKRVLAINGPYLAPIDPLPGLEIRFRAFLGGKAITETQPFTFPGAPLSPPPPSTLVPCTQNRDFSAYRWEQRHAAALAATAALNPSLAFIGDSITHFFGGEPDDHSPNPGYRVAPDIWERYFSRWNPVNLGFGNDRIENALWRVLHGEIDHCAPQSTFAILIGTNNMRDNTDREIAQGISNLCQTILTLKPQSNILLQAIYPRTKYPERLPNLNRLISQLTSPRIRFCTPGNAIANPNGDGTPAPGTTHDGIHPTHLGYSLIAPQLANEIDRLTP